MFSQGSAFQSVNCYSSTDLVRWTFVGTPLTLQSSGDLGPNRVVERPKVSLPMSDRSGMFADAQLPHCQILYNSSTGKYVMWMHIDSSSYGEAKVGVAVGTSVCGSYTYMGSCVHYSRYIATLLTRRHALQMAASRFPISRYGPVPGR